MAPFAPQAIAILAFTLFNFFSNCDSFNFNSSTTSSDEFLEGTLRDFDGRSTENVLRDGRAFGTFTSPFRPGSLMYMSRPSLFHIVKFPNDECLDATNQSGVCYTPLECKSFGGTGSTLCAKGYGTCCSISRSCNEVTSQKVVYFLNPSYPSSDMSSSYCAFTAEIRDADVCQIKLDFLEFNIDQPSDGFCFGDRLTVTAGGLSAKSIPILCGDNKDQHMYVSIPRGEKQRSASLLIQTNGIGAYKWKIRLTQINCVRNPAEVGAGDAISGNSMYTVNRNTYSTAINNNLLRRRSSTQPIAMTNRMGDDGDSFLTQITRRGKRSLMLQKFQNLFAKLKVTVPAPSGCLQYFTDSRGTISSFNFGQYLSNMDYAICIERQPTTCKITFKADEFGIDKSSGAKVSSGVGDIDCGYDYLMVPGASLTGDSIPAPTRDRFCGGFLNPIQGLFRNDPIISKANGPIVLRFHTDNSYDHSVKAGFKITYEQSSNCEQTIVDSANLNPFSTSSSLYPYSNTATQVSAAALSDGSYSINKLLVEQDLPLNDTSPSLDHSSSNFDLGRTEPRNRSNTKRFRF